MARRGSHVWTHLVLIFAQCKAATLKGKGCTGGRCRHSLMCLPPLPACAGDVDRQPRTSGREALGELSVTERCNRLAVLVTSPLILADRCEECPRLLGKGHRLILLPDEPARAFSDKQSPPSCRSGSKELDWGRGVSTLHMCWGTWTNPDSEVSRPSSASQAAAICNLRSESCGWRASCYLTPPALAISPFSTNLPKRVDWQPGEAATGREKSPKNPLDKSCLLLTSCDFFCNPACF